MTVFNVLKELLTGSPEKIKYISDSIESGNGGGGITTWSSIQNKPNSFPTSPSIIQLTYFPSLIVDASQQNLASFTARITLTGNATLNISNPTDGQIIEFEITQDSTGNRLLTLNSIFNFGTDADSTKFVLTTTGNKTDYFRVKYNQVRNRWDVLALIRGY